MNSSVETFMQRIVASMLLVVCFYSSSKAQLPQCGSGVPYFFVDLTGNPAGTWVSPSHSRLGKCCGVTGSDECTSFEIKLDSLAGAIKLEIASGAIPGGSMYFQIDCGPMQPVGSPVCLSGVGPHRITFCKPGNNENTYRITSISVPKVQPDDTTRKGCTVPVRVYGMQTSSITWTSISPGVKGQYNGYLSCTTGCDKPNFSPDDNAPAYIDYQVCGMPILTGCGFNTARCDTVRIWVRSRLTASLAPSPASYCSSATGVSITAVPTGGDGNYSVVWKNPSNAVVGTGATYFANAPGNYFYELKDGLTGLGCAAYTANVPVAVNQAPMVSAGPDQQNCATSSVVSLSGASSNTSSVIWSGGAGTFSPNANTLNATYSPTASEIAAGSVTLTLTSTGALAGCSNVSDQVVLTWPSVLDVKLAHPPILCNGQSVSISATVSGGVLPYTYLWDNGATTSSITVGAGSHCLTVTDAMGCGKQACIVVAEPSVLGAGISKSDVTTNGGSNGSATVNTTGGTAPYTYAWSNGQSGATASGLSSGIYGVTVSDANGCTVSLSVSISEPGCSTLSASATFTPVTCMGFATGTATANAVGGVSPYVYSWSNGQTSQMATGLVAGSYAVKITDAVNCVAITNIQVTEPDALSGTLSSTNATTVGGANGTATVSVSGGNPLYTYSWSNGQTNATATGLAKGSYTVEVIDAKGCAITLQTNVGEPACNGYSITASSLPALCKNGNSGSASVSVTNATAPYTYSWSNGQTSQSISNLMAGTYTVQVNDAENCQAITTVTVAEPTELTASISGTDLVCHADKSGTVSLTVSGGSLPYYYAWSNGSTVEDLTALSAGTYSVSITDQNGCSLVKNVSISEPAELVVTHVSENVKCFGGTDGSISLTAIGGTMPYVYNWNNGSSFSSLSGLSEGNNIYTVTDAHGCLKKDSVMIFQPTGLSGSMVSNPATQVGAANGSATVMVSGGTPSYSYSWSNGQNTATASGLAKGTYTVTVTDSNGCSFTNQVTISEPSCTNVTASITPQHVTCNGLSNGEAQVNAMGGVAPYTFDWSNGTSFPMATNLAAGTYTVRITDSVNCVITQSVTITQPAALTANLVPEHILCFGKASGSIEVIANGGTAPYAYQWNVNGTTNKAEALTAGSYQVTVKDTQGCELLLTTDLTQPDSLQLTVVNTSVTCYNGSDGQIITQVKGGVSPYVYQWNQGSNAANLTALTANTYSLSVWDANGCVVQNSAIHISEPTPVQATVTHACPLVGTASTVVQVNANGGTGSTYAVSFDNGVTFKQPGVYADTLPAGGTYTIKVVDERGCMNLVDVQASLYPEVSIAGTAYPNCFAVGQTTASLDVTVSPAGMNYEISTDGGLTFHPANQHILELPIGKQYDVVIKYQDACLSVAKQVDLKAAFDATMSTSLYTGGKQISCYGKQDGSIQTFVKGGQAPYAYKWMNESTIIGNGTQMSGLTAGAYKIEIVDANGCMALLDVVLEQPDSLMLTGTTANPTCYNKADGSIDVVAAGGTKPYAINWSNGVSSEDQTSITSGVYAIQVLDANGCSVNAQYVLTQPDSLQVSAKVDVPLCAGKTGGIDLSITGGTQGYQINWSNGLTTEDVVLQDGGTYNAQVTDAQGCIANVIVDVPLIVNLTNIISTTDLKCFEDNSGAIDLTVSSGNGPFVFQWSNGATTEDLQNLQAGTYEVTIADKNGCIIRDTVVVKQNNPLDASADVSVYTGGHGVSNYGAADGFISVSVSGGAQPYAYNWSNGQTDATATGLPAGDYQVTITDANGCTYVVNKTLTEANNLAMPSGYSPNSDGNNDTYVIRGIDAFPENTLIIMNRWGNEVYRADFYQNQWNGLNLQGEELPDGTYFAILKLHKVNRVLTTYVDLRRR